LRLSQLQDKYTIKSNVVETNVNSNSNPKSQLQDKYTIKSKSNAIDTLNFISNQNANANSFVTTNGNFDNELDVMKSSGKKISNINLSYHFDEKILEGKKNKFVYK